jgi:hypothetical protein
MHLGLKRNFQVMPGAQWLELLCKHIPDRHEHLVRYVGWYSNRARGERAKALKAQQPAKTPVADEVPASEITISAKATWARLIRKVYEADPLVCPRCKGPMRVIALIDDPTVVRRILEHLGRSGARTRRARPARASARVAAKRGHSHHLPPGPGHRLAQCEGPVRPHRPLAL